MTGRPGPAAYALCLAACPWRHRLAGHGRTRGGMPLRPEAVTFDVIETLMPLEPLRERFTVAGLRHLLELWFTFTLRDGIARWLPPATTPVRRGRHAGAANRVRVPGGRGPDRWRPDTN